MTSLKLLALSAAMIIAFSSSALSWEQSPIQDGGTVASDNQGALSPEMAKDKELMALEDECAGHILEILAQLQKETDPAAREKLQKRIQFLKQDLEIVIKECQLNKAVAAENTAQITQLKKILEDLYNSGGGTPNADEHSQPDIPEKMKTGADQTNKNPDDA
ncbi:hypothetical protein [Desulfobacter latus]|uniref:Uncharacterized protein n=1 Tax=Desulfobacter latus TaxID=2292 RepID=A0A850T3N9_9BACT|nr:hypothetical protein [Desulfobacter latus]NWH03822.1 hypothetical protein [Desulfobacter latus]